MQEGGGPVIDSAEELYAEEVGTGEKQERCFHMAVVKGFFEDGCAKVQFDGDAQPSEKKYAYINTFLPEKGDKVLIGKVGASYVIIGKIRYDEPPEAGDGEDKHYVTSDELSNYVGKGDFEGHGHDKISYGVRELGIRATQYGIIPFATKESAACSMGSTDYPFPSVYAKQYYKNGKELITVDALGDYAKKSDLKQYAKTADITPDRIKAGTGLSQYQLVISGASILPYRSTSATGDVLSLGSGSYQFLNVYAKQIYADGKSVLTATDLSSYAKTADITPDRIKSGTGLSQYQLVISGTSVLPYKATSATKDVLSLGSGSYQFLNIYAKQLYANGKAVLTSADLSTYAKITDITADRIKSGSGSTLYQLVVSGASVLPYRSTSAAKDVLSLGSSSYQLLSVYAKQYYANGIQINPARVSYSAGSYAEMTSSGFQPNSNGGHTLGSSSYKWKQLFASNATISTSDRREKKHIKELKLIDKYRKMFCRLQPVRFRFKKPMSDSGRYHVGFISQDVEAAMEGAGLGSRDFAGFIHDEQADSYGLRYSEFIALNTMMIQELMEKQEVMEKEIRLLKEEREEESCTGATERKHLC